MTTTIENLRQGAALVTGAPARATLVVRGEDRTTWLNGLLTCDVTQLAQGRGLYGLATSKVGRILADAFVVDAGDRLLVGLPPWREPDINASFDRYLVMEDVELEAAFEALAWVHVHGPRARSLVAGLTTPRVVAWADLDVTGLGGAVVVADASSLAEVLATLTTAGAVMGNEAAWEGLRHERAVPAFGPDFDESTYPQEASLETSAVSFQKGCYLGQEVVCRLQMRGHVHRKLTPLVLTPGAPLPAPNDSVTTSEGEPAGVVTSAAESPTLGAPIAFAMIKYAFFGEGRELTVGRHPARIATVPVP